MDVGGQRVEIDRDAVVGGRLAGNLDAGQPGRARVGHRLGAGEPALLVAEGDPGHDGSARRHPDLHPASGPVDGSAPGPARPSSLFPLVVRGVPGRRRARARSAAARPGARCRDGGGYRCGRIAGTRSWNVRPTEGSPMAVICQPLPTRCTLDMTCAV